MFKGAILWKLGLSANFPRAALCARKSALGAGLIEASTIIATLKIKLHIRSKRKQGTTWESLSAQEEHVEIEAGR